VPVNTSPKKQQHFPQPPNLPHPRTASPPLSRCPRIAPKASKIWPIQHWAAAFFPNPANFLSLRRAAGATPAGCPWRRAPGTACWPCRSKGKPGRAGSGSRSAFHPLRQKERALQRLRPAALPACRWWGGVGGAAFLPKKLGAGSGADRERTRGTYDGASECELWMLCVLLQAVYLFHPLS
jgi:hypothetical protein